MRRPASSGRWLEPVPVSIGMVGKDLKERRVGNFTLLVRVAALEEVGRFQEIAALGVQPDRG